MKLLALVPYPLDTAPAQRYRIEQWAPYLREEGIEVTVWPFADAELARIIYQPGRYGAKAIGMVRGLLARLAHVWAAGRFNAVLVQREACLLGPALFERFARLRCPAFVYDFDDAVYLPYVSPTNRYLSYLKFPGKTRTLCRMSRVVLAGNQSLAEYARRYNTNVHVVPSTISLRVYGTRPSGGPAAIPVIGWTGSHSSAQYLAGMKGALCRLREKRDFRVLVIGVDHVDLPGIEIAYRPWRSETEAQDLWAIDIGIMPLRDDPWARGKCGMKALQYMGVGLPVVASPIGANADIVEDGVSGLHARTEDEWVAALTRLVDDARLRAEMGAAGRRRVEREFSAESEVPRVAALLKDLRQ